MLLCLKIYNFKSKNSLKLNSESCEIRKKSDFLKISSEGFLIEKYASLRGVQTAKNPLRTGFSGKKNM